MGGVALLAFFLALLALGFGYRDYAGGQPPARTALLLAGAAASHAYVGLWAGLGLSFFLHGSRRPARTLGWLLHAAGLALGLGAFALVPWLAALFGALPSSPLRFGPTPLFEPRTWPLAVAAAIVIGLLAVVARARGGLDRRVLYAGHAGLVGLILPGLVPVVPESAPAAFAALRGAGATGLAVTTLAIAWLGFSVVLAKRSTTRPDAGRMPRALTPAVLEMCPPPPPPRRWGSVVPVALLVVLLALRILAGG